MLKDLHSEAHMWLSEISSSVSNKSVSIVSPDRTPVAFVFSLLVMLLLTAVVLVSNLAIAAAVLSSPQLRNKLNNYFILNLCLAQVLAALVVLPLSIASFVSQPKVLGVGLCLFAQFLHACLVNAMCWTVCLISVGRHYMILMPMVHEGEVTLFRTLMALLVVWLFSVVPSGYLLISQERGIGATVCCGWGLGVLSSSEGYVLCVTILEFLLPGVTMLCMYFPIYRVAVRAVRGADEQAISTISGQVADRGDISPCLHQSVEELPVNLRAEFQNSAEANRDSISLGANGTSAVVFWKNKDRVELRKGGYKPTIVLSSNPVLTSKEGAAKEALVESAWGSASWVASSRTDITCSLPNGNGALHRSSNENMENVRISRNERSRGVAAKKAARTLMMVVGTFWLLCLPYFAFNVYLAIAHRAPDFYSGGVEKSFTIIREIIEMPRGLSNLDPEQLNLLENSLKNAFNISRSCITSLKNQVGEERAPLFEMLSYITEWLLYCTFAINPFLYGFMDRDIRTQLSLLLSETWQVCSSCGRKGSRVQPSSPSQVCDAESGVALDSARLENIIEFLQRTDHREDQTPPRRPRSSIFV
ncbi:octopamine receptor-like [Macrobrachium rosenbergii]|uniref:octopamine receptor-like n=1 Tax=Macrobrachium rosenbergii TaxID=79674 RepID=UPI0034D4ACB5